MNLLSENIDLETEKQVLSSLLSENGSKIWINLCDIIHLNSFVADSHQILYDCINNYFKNNTLATKINYPDLTKISEKLNYKDFFNRKEEKTYLKTIAQTQFIENEIKQKAIKLKKLEITRIIREKIKTADLQYSNITGEEKASEILSIIEKPIFEFSKLIHGFDFKGPSPLFENIHDYINKKLDGKNDIVAIKTSWDAYDFAIGGGLRPGTVNIIASRFGGGKSSAGENIGMFVASNGIPVLLLDNEMSFEERAPRDLAMISGISISDIEWGDFRNYPDKIRKVKDAGDKLQKLKYDYKNICGIDFEEVILMMKHWVLTKVGLNSEGVANPCLIILDYIKTQNANELSKNIQEYILLGLLITHFVNFCQQYKVAGLNFAQVNREGINDETSAVISGSDRILFYSSSCVFLKEQSEEEIEKQRELGLKDIYDKKLIVLKSRHGPGLTRGDYIHMKFKKHYCKFIPGPTAFQLENDIKNNKFIEEKGPEF